MTGGRGAEGRESRTIPPGLERPADEPTVPPDLDLRELPRPVRAELRGLPPELAQRVGGHLLMAGRLVDEDPRLAFAHAEAARRRASRLPIAREASAETAYAVGEYAHALNEYRALRRMTGSAEYLPVIMDCERALGRPQRALQLAREGATAQLDAGTRAEMLIVESGARADLGQRDEALRLLRAAVARVHHPAETAARLRFAYAELLLEDDPEHARALLDEADLLDPDSGARERLDELDGVALGDIELAEDEPDEPVDLEPEADDEPTVDESADEPTSGERGRGEPEPEVDAASDGPDADEPQGV